jgi:hypothetical protein
MVFVLVRGFGLVVPPSQLKKLSGAGNLVAVRIAMNKALTPRKPYEPSAAIVERAGRVNEAILGDCVAVPRFDLSRLASQTESQLDRAGRELREGKGVLEMSLFIRWVQMSGVLNLVAIHSTEVAVSLRKKIESLVIECGDMMRGGRIEPHYSPSDISEILRKVDSLEKMMAERFPPCSALVEVEAGESEKPVPMEPGRGMTLPSALLSEGNDLAVSTPHGRASLLDAGGESLNGDSQIAAARRQPRGGNLR